MVSFDCIHYSVYAILTEEDCRLVSGGATKVESVVHILLVIDAIAMIVLIVLQSSKSEGLGAISGGAEELFGKQKARGIDYVLHRGTVVTAVLFFVLAFVSGYIL